MLAKNLNKWAHGFLGRCLHVNVKTWNDRKHCSDYFACEDCGAKYRTGEGGKPHIPYPDYCSDLNLAYQVEMALPEHLRVEHVGFRIEGVGTFDTFSVTTASAYKRVGVIYNLVKWDAKVKEAE